MDTAEPSRRLLAIGGHPDDVEFTSGGGSLARGRTKAGSNTSRRLYGRKQGQLEPERPARNGGGRSHLEQEADSEVLGIAEVV